MALFSFTDITFTNKSDARGSANKLTEDSQYQNNILRFPIDIGEADKGHYMIIHINEQMKTKYSLASTTASGALPTIVNNKNLYGTSNIVKAVEEVGNLVGSKVNQLSGKNIVPSFSFSQNAKQNFLRTVTRTTDTIALYMPDTLHFTHNQAYTDLNLSGALAAGVATIQSINDTLSKNKNYSASDLFHNFSPFIARAVQSSDLLRAAFAAVDQRVINPMMEMIYTAPAFREFRFDFMFYPRSEKESVEVFNIIKRLKFHQAPEVDYSDGGLGFFLIPPSEFDIQFYYNGKQNPNIPKISTCVLTAIDVDYAPNGFAAYEVPGSPDPNEGGTGSPVGIRLSLNFKETEIMTKNHFSNLSQQSREISKEYSKTGAVNEKGEGLY